MMFLFHLLITKLAKISIKNPLYKRTTFLKLLYTHRYSFKLIHIRIELKMSSSTAWKLADRPNYDTNIDKRFPYSEVPYLEDYDLLKIPASLNETIPHIDYWGEGRVATSEGIRGYLDCYNVNHQYQLVSAGVDKDRKIPNRIPVLGYEQCDTTRYIRSDSVLNVTVAGGQGHITTSCAGDIARIVNKEAGRVVVYGVHLDPEEISTLSVNLAWKGLYYSPNASLPSDLEGLTYYRRAVSFLNLDLFTEELYNEVRYGNFDTAVTMVKNFEAASDDVFMATITRLIISAPRQIMSFAYKLWHSNAINIVRKYFPKSFQNILGEEVVTIVNKRYLQALKLDVNTDSYNDRRAWGHGSQIITSQRVSWKILPVWNSTGVTFKLYNIHGNMFLKLDATADSAGDRQAWGSTNSDEDRHRYYLEPLIEYGTLVFFIINYKFVQGLKLDVNTDGYGDRVLWGHNGSVAEDDERFKWVIATW